MSFTLPYAFGGPPATGKIKAQPEDFIVEENLGFELTGEGEHIFLKIQKRGENTDYLARQIAKYAGLPKMAVSYAGMKDRFGYTTQWFSVHIPGKREVDWSGLESESVTVQETTRHNRKLKKGALRGNRFEITVRELDGDNRLIEQRLTQVKSSGVPNYFGPQRFGREGYNLIQAEALFKGELRLRDRNLEGIYLSAARSAIFNQVLSQRVESHNWNQAIIGDVFMFADSHSFFRAELTPETLARVAALSIHPSGPLWGKGELATTEEALVLEATAANALPVLSEGLERIGMETSRRPLRLLVGDLDWAFCEQNALRLRFTLPAGAYATVVLREMVAFEGSVD